MIHIHSASKKKKIPLILTVALSAMIFTSCGKPAAPVQGQNTDFSMGTAITTTLYGNSEDAIEANLSAVSECLASVNQDISWRMDGSMTALFNENHEAVVGDREEVYRIALDVADKSGGAFDPTVLPISRLWDIGGEGQRHPSDEEIREAMADVGYQAVSLKDGLLKTEAPGVMFELGAVGKGYGLTAAAEQIDREAVSGGILSAGSSILTFGTKPDGSGFRVALRNPRGGPEDRIGIFALTDLSISTSGDYEKYFEEDGKRYHHILDARTGKPADSGLMSVTVIADNSTLCDALSTAGFILGLDEGMKLLDNYGVMGVFIDNQRNVYYNNERILELLSFDGEDEGYHLKPYEG